MERQLLIAGPRRGHPFRQSVARVQPKPRSAARSADDSDLKLFVLSFTAFFICFYTFFL